MQHVLEIAGLCAGYNGTNVLQGVDLAVRQGDYIAVFGPNGGGKTTLLKCILGLLHPRAGTVKVFGQPAAQTRSRIGYVPQYATMRYSVPMSVQDVVLMGMIAKPYARIASLFRTSSVQLQAVEEVLEQVGLVDLRHRRIRELSGGQKQRVIVARALIAQPDMLLLDEPTANIDPQGKFCFYEFLGTLPQHITTIVVSHDLSIATSGFSALAVVNGTLHFDRGGSLTPELLATLYGQHEPNCPMGTFIANAPNIIPHMNDIIPPDPGSTAS